MKKAVVLFQSPISTAVRNRDFQTFEDTQLHSTSTATCKGSFGSSDLAPDIRIPVWYIGLHQWLTPWRKPNINMYLCIYHETKSLAKSLSARHSWISPLYITHEAFHSGRTGLVPRDCGSRFKQGSGLLLSVASVCCDELVLLYLLSFTLLFNFTSVLNRRFSFDYFISAIV